MVGIGIMPDWEIRYSKYVGDLTLFDKTIYSKRADELFSEKISDNIFLTYDRMDGKLMMVEIGDIRLIIPDIDIKGKRAIINKIKEYLVCPVSK